MLAEHAQGGEGIRERFAAAGLPPSAEVVAISTAAHARGVRRAVAEAAALHGGRRHVVVVCTDAVRAWCGEECGGDFVIVLGRHVVFQRREDAALAAFRWHA